MNAISKRWTVPAALGTAAVALVGAAWFGVTAGHDKGDGGDNNNGFAALPSAAPAKLSISDGATGVAPDTPLTLTAPAGERLGAVLVAAQANVVAGAFSADHRTWTQTGHLKFDTTYAVSAVTEAADHTALGLQNSNFVTGPAPAKQISFQQIAPNDGETVGVGQPVVLYFSNPVTNRAAVEAALQVTSVPAQAGHWSWLSDSRVDYRPQSYWKPGTKVSVQLGLNGVDAGDGRFGAADKALSFTVGRDQETTVNVSTDQAVVYRDGKQYGSFPVTGGMPGLDTWGGTFAVMDKAPDVHMDSRTAGLGDEYDIPDVKWDVHITSSGTYIHAAPWSVDAQGVRNVSHGCIGTSNDEAEWFFNSTLPGDVVRVTTRPRTGAPGNGYNDWTTSWTQWLAGSAIPS